MRFFPIILFFISLPALAIISAEGKPRNECPLCVLVIFGEPCLEGKEEATKFCEYERLPDQIDGACMDIVNSSECIDVEALKIIKILPAVRQLETLAVIKDKLYGSDTLSENNIADLLPNEKISYLQSEGTKIIRFVNEE